MRNFILGVVVVAFVAAFVGVFCYFDLLLAPVAIADRPMPMETYFAKKAVHARISHEVPGDPPDPSAVGSSAASPAVTTPEWKDARQISPAELTKKLSGPKNARPVVLQVGFKVLYDGAHIPGAIFAGPASTAEGLARLKAAAAKIARDKEVIIYCGCCPWEKCPNVHPAYEELRKLGFSRLVVLLIPQDFAHDWVDAGLPVERKH